jgi:hypothetical protein
LRKDVHVAGADRVFCGAKKRPASPRRGKRGKPAEPEFVYGPGEEPRPGEGEPTGWHHGDLL